MPLAPTSPRRRLLVWIGVAFAVAGTAAIFWIGHRRRLEDVRRLAVRAARRHRLPPELVYAVVLAESGGNPRAASRAQAYGLMQLRIPTASDMAGRPVSVEELYEPVFNLDLGCRYLREMLIRFDGDRRLALMAYNAGPSTVERWLRQQPDPDKVLEQLAYPQTRAYVRKVLSLASG